jgi:Fic family protein
VRAYVPAPLPPKPPLDLGRFMRVYERAIAAVGRLDGVTTILPSTPLFLYMYVRKEALLSSQIEGTQSSLSDLLLFENHEAPTVELDDVTEVSNYVAAIEHGVSRMRGGFPLSLRLLCEMHAILLKSGRGAAKQPGEFRRSQNWIGGTRPGNALFVPPPPNRLDECLDALERFLHSEDSALPPLIRAGLAHVQFETIHPFLDGNGRLGRLLITLILCEAGVMREPILYLSLFLKSRRDDYYRLLQEVHRQQIAGLGRAAPSALRVHELMQASPIVTIQTVCEKLAVSFPTASTTLDKLAKINVVHETTGRQRGRIYAYSDYLALLDRGTDPLPT